VYNSQENYERGAAEFAEAGKLNGDYGYYSRGIHITVKRTMTGP
jgi:hypothetical protein